MVLAVSYGKRSPCWQDASRRRPLSVFVPLSPGWSCLTPMSPAAHWSSWSGTTRSHQSACASLITSSARRRWQRGRTTLNSRQVRRFRMAINKTHQRKDCEVYWYFHGCSESYLWDMNHEIRQKSYHQYNNQFLFSLLQNKIHREPQNLQRQSFYQPLVPKCFDRKLNSKLKVTFKHG